MEWNFFRNRLLQGRVQFEYLGGYGARGWIETKGAGMTVRQKIAGQARLSF